MTNLNGKTALVTGASRGMGRAAALALAAAGAQVLVHYGRGAQEADGVVAEMHDVREDVEAGGLVSYGPNFSDQYRRAAEYVDKILRGTKPGDLPVEQPTKFELVINLTTAKALGLNIPPSLLSLANDLIE